MTRAEALAILDKKEKLVTCRTCHYTWTPRSGNPRPKACPECKTRMRWGKR